jgi:signal transduction histidine kinase
MNQKLTGGFSMKRFMIVALAMVFALCVVGNALADEEAAKKECVEKCEAAAALIKEKGLDAAKAEIGKKDGPFVSEVTYVFLQGMDGTMLAHPFKPSLVGKNLIDLKDKAGKAFFAEFIKVAKEAGTGWVEYMWPKPGAEEPSPKNSYVLKVDDNTFVGAGYYK